MSNQIRLVIKEVELIKSISEHVFQNTKEAYQLMPADERYDLGEAVFYAWENLADLQPIEQDESFEGLTELMTKVRGDHLVYAQLVGCVTEAYWLTLCATGDVVKKDGLYYPAG